MAEVMEALGLLGGAAAVVGALSAWIGKLWADRILSSAIPLKTSLLPVGGATLDGTKGVRRMRQIPGNIGNACKA